MGLTLDQYETFGRLKGAVQRKADGKEAKQPARRSLLPTASLRLVVRFIEERLLVAGKGGAAGATNLWLMLTLRFYRPHACSVRMPP